MAVGTYVPAPESTETWERTPEGVPIPHPSTFQRFSRKFKEEPLVPLGKYFTSDCEGSREKVGSFNRRLKADLDRYHFAFLFLFMIFISFY